MNTNTTIDLETCIEEFLVRGKELLNTTPTAQQIFEEVTARYRNQRIEGAEVDYDGDLLLLEWGISRLMQTPEPKDLRDLGDGEPEWYADGVPGFSMARQVHVETGNDDDFDGKAIAMHIELGFSSGELKSSEHWIESPEDIEAGFVVIQNNESLYSFWTMPASRVAVFVGTVG